jgi:predicted amidohydrolase YtcJ
VPRTVRVLLDGKLGAGVTGKDVIITLCGLYNRGEVLNAAERVTVAQALKGSTIDAAWMCHADNLVGSLAAGKAADFVLLGADPLSHEADPDAVRDIAVLATYLDGAQTHSVS